MPSGKQQQRVEKIAKGESSFLRQEGVLRVPPCNEFEIWIFDRAHAPYLEIVSKHLSSWAFLWFI